jgi:hypothetical protein
LDDPPFSASFVEGLVREALKSGDWHSSASRSLMTLPSFTVSR